MLNMSLYFHYEVSIHAPARGATKPNALKGFFQVCFNPRAREGRDLVSRKDALTTK